jgi:hypothetical protein
VVRAAAAAGLYLDGKIPSLAVAAEACGSNVNYIRAAIALLKADDASLLNLTMAGRVSLTEAANLARLQTATRVTVDEAVAPAVAVASWRVWTPEQRAEFGRGAGVSNLWDHAIAPVLTEDSARPQAAE